MGLDLSLLAYVHGDFLDLSRPTDDGEAAAAIVKSLYPRTDYGFEGSSPLDAGGFPPKGRINVGTFEDGLLIATRDAALVNPTKLSTRYLRVAGARAVLLITQQTFYDMFAYARWVQGELVRSISVNPIGRVWESIGQPEAFETPFWEGKHQVSADYPLPFHPLDMSDAALRSLLRLHVEGPPGPGLADPSQTTVHCFGRR